MQLRFKQCLLLEDPLPSTSVHQVSFLALLPLTSWLHTTPRATRPLQEKSALKGERKIPLSSLDGSLAAQALCCTNQSLGHSFLGDRITAWDAGHISELGSSQRPNSHSMDIFKRQAWLHFSRTGHPTVGCTDPGCREKALPQSPPPLPGSGGGAIRLKEVQRRKPR